MTSKGAARTGHFAAQSLCKFVRITRCGNLALGERLEESHRPFQRLVQQFPHV